MRNFIHGKSCDSSCCLRIQDLSVKIGTDAILTDVNLHVHCGQLVALIGPNGAGKSTLVKAILGQLEYDGIIAFSAPGMRHRKMPRIGYVPQSPTFDAGDSVSVADLFACCLSRRPAFLGLSEGMRDKAMECLERVHGEDLIDKRIGTLSGGELQRVLLALALEPLPNILILMDMLDEIRKRYDLSILMITHDFDMLPTYADKVVLIDHTIAKKGTPVEVLESDEFRHVFHRKGGAV